MAFIEALPLKSRREGRIISTRANTMSIETTPLNLITYHEQKRVCLNFLSRAHHVTQSQASIDIKSLVLFVLLICITQYYHP